MENGRYQLVHCHGSAYELREPLAGNGQQGTGLLDNEAAADQARLFCPRFAVSGSSNIIYFCDANCVRRFIPATREIRTLAGIPAKIPPADSCNADAATRFNAPWGLALDEDAGLLYVADSCNHCIKRIFIGTCEMSILVPGSSGLKYPIGLVSNPQHALCSYLSIADDLLLFVKKKGMCSIHTTDYDADTTAFQYNLCFALLFC